MRRRRFDEQGTDQQRAPRQRLRVLGAAGVVAAVAVTWGGFAAVGTTMESSASTLHAEALPRPTAASTAASPTAGRTADAPATDAPPSRGPSPASTVGSPSVAAPAPRQGPGLHEAHEPGRDVPVVSPGTDPLGAPLPEEPSAGNSPVPGPGARQESSLEEAATQPLATAAGAAAGGPTEGGDRTAGLTPRAPIDPVEVTGSGLAALGGCLSEYGTDGQCLPVVPPSMTGHAQNMVESGISLDTMNHPWSCSEVRQLFADGLIVRQDGVDPQKLDADGDGTACGDEN